MSVSPAAGDPRSSGPDSNGLKAPAYVPLTDVDDAVGRALLTTLRRARIAAYLTPVPGIEDAEHVRLFVAAEERSDARTIVAAALRSDGTEAPARPDEPARDPLDGVDTDAAFAALVSDWHVDTVAAVREAERQLRDEDADWRARLVQPPAEDQVWLDDDHYVPPPPPPLPRLAPPTIGAVALIIGSILVFAFGGRIGFGSNVTFLLGVGGILAAAYILVMRLRERRDTDEDDDGAVL
jgi:hypothetical protein